MTSHAGLNPSPAGEAWTWTQVVMVMRVAAAACWVGWFGMYVRVWIQPQEARGNLEVWAGAVVDGTSQAPFQYRLAVPEALMWMHRTFGWRVGSGQQIIDGVCLAIGAVLIQRLIERTGHTVWTVPAALYGAFLGMGCMFWGKFETMASFAAVTLGTLALVGAVRHRVLWFSVTAALLVGTRTDLLMALAVAELARWWFVDRRRSALFTAIALGLTGVVATKVIASWYPDIAYVTDVVQLSHNMQPSVWLTALGFLAPLALPYALARRSAAVREAIRAHHGVLVPLIALVGFELVACTLTGRIEEVRLFFPLTGALAVIGAIGWDAALRLRPSGQAPAVVTTQDLG